MFASDKKAEFLQILGYECAISAELASTGEEGGANHRAGDGELSPVDETTFFDTIASVEDDESIFIEKMTKHPGVKADDEGDVKTCEEGGDEMAAEDDVEVERNLISGDFDRAG